MHGLLSGLRRRLQLHRAELALALRVTIAAVLALVLALAFHLRLPLWAVLTALVVTQTSVGRSLVATIDYLAGTVGGALFGGAVAMLIPHPDEASLVMVMAIAVAPLAFAAARYPSLAAAPVTAIIVVLVPQITHVGTAASAVDRVLEVGLGALTGFTVSLVVLPSSAHRLAREMSAQTLKRMAAALEQLLAGLETGLDYAALHRIQDGIGEGLGHLQRVDAEASRERFAHLSSGPDTEAHVRTLFRLRHDVVMLGRAAIFPLRQDFAARLAPPLEKIAAAFAAFLRDSAAALIDRTAPPALDAAKAALGEYDAEIAASRQEGWTVTLSSDEAERLFAVGFALDQMLRNFEDLGRCVGEWSRLPDASAPKPLSTPSP